ncbi:ParB/RepB/Spo0J family partition protein [Patescibacteria group bacterium]|nr:ParB/RepB/Spo0J family partition protein [Patescibacteria group bacterium]
MSNGLGRGLSSLIPKKVNKTVETVPGEAEADVIAAADKSRILQISPDLISNNPMQPRKDFAHQPMEELVESIKQYGIIQPIIVSQKGDRFELIAGERRLRAAKIIGLDKVPAIARDAEEQEKLEMALIENIQREDLNAVEQAAAFRRLIDEFNLTQEELAKRVGKARSSVSNILRVLNLPEEIRQALIEGKITEGHAKLIAGLDSENRQSALFKKIIRGGLTVGASIKEARTMGGTKAARIKINYEDRDKEETLRDFFGAKVEIKRKGKGGQIVIDFYSDDELGEIMEKIK